MEMMNVMCLCNLFIVDIITEETETVATHPSHLQRRYPQRRKNKIHSKFPYFTPFLRHAITIQLYSIL